MTLKKRHYDVMSGRKNPMRLSHSHAEMSKKCPWNVHEMSIALRKGDARLSPQQGCGGWGEWSPRYNFSPFSLLLSVTLEFPHKADRRRTVFHLLNLSRVTLEKIVHERQTNILVLTCNQGRTDWSRQGWASHAHRTSSLLTSQSIPGPIFDAKHVR